MANLKTPAALSESEEMYLITVARAIEDGVSGPVPLSYIAEQLAVSTASANEMIRKMDDAGLVTYLPYKGVELAPKGREMARRVLRFRRLWEVFLTDQLGLSLNEADALACRMEHITPEEVADRLADHLGNPTVSPQGRAIPSGSGAVEAAVAPLHSVSPGTTATIAAVNSDTATRGFLRSEGIVPGAAVTVLASGAGILLAVDGARVSLDATVAELIEVEGTG
jgi:DtxR family Mn-dependent transcriptional regulator